MVAKIIRWVWLSVQYMQIPRNLMWQWWHGLRLDASWRFSGLPLVYHAGGNNPFTRLVFSRLGRRSTISIGRDFRALSKPKYNSLGVIQKTLLRTASYGAELIVGNNVGMSGCTVCACRSVRIGDDTLIGTGAIITDSDLHPIDPMARLRGESGKAAPVKIGAAVFIGARAIILKGVTVGNGATIGAGAVVSKDIPANAIAVGNPARVINSK